MRRRTLNNFENAALLRATTLARSPETAEQTAEILRAIDRGIDDEPALAEVLAKSGTTVEAMYAEQDRGLYRFGRRVTLPADPCPVTLGGSDRPCLRAKGHPPGCEFADVNTADQRAAMRRFEEEYGAVIAAVALADRRTT